MTYFDQIDPIYDTFDQIYVHKPDWEVFKNYFSQVYGHKFGQNCHK